MGGRCNSTRNRLGVDVALIFQREASLPKWRSQFSNRGMRFDRRSLCRLVYGGDTSQPTGIEQYAVCAADWGIGMSRPRRPQTKPGTRGLDYSRLDILLVWASTIRAGAQL